MGTKREVYPPGVKRCIDCKELMSVSQFYERSDQPGKPRAYCKDCSSIRGTLHRAAHREQYNQKAMEYYFAHVEQYRENGRRFLIEHPLAGALYSRKQYRNHREKRKAQRRRYYHRNAFSERSRQSRRRFIESLGNVDYAVIWERDQGICHICRKEVNLEELHFDHVLPLARGGQHTMDNVKVAHAHCNLSKGTKLMEEMLTYLESLHQGENPFARKLAESYGLKEEEEHGQRG